MDAEGIAGLLAHLESGEARPIYLLIGEDRREVEAAERLLEERLVDDDLRALNAARLHGGEVTPEDVVEACSTLPMMAPRRLVVLREPERLGASPEALVAYLDDPCPSTALVFVPREHDRRRRLSQRMESTSFTVRFEPPRPGDLAAWMRRHLEPRGLTIEPAALALLEDLVEVDTLLLSNELEKLALYCQRAGVVTSEDVEAVLGRTRTVEVWALTGAIEDGDPGAAIAALRRLLAQGAAAPLVIGTLDWCLGRLLASAPPPAPPHRRRAVEARRRALSGRGGVLFDLLRDADRAVRTSGADVEAALERAVLAAAG